MTNFFELPHEKLLAYQEARKLLACIEAACIKDAKLRDQATEAARSVCLNIAEGAGRSGSADKALVYAIARGECCEAAGALDLALLSRLCKEEAAQAGIEHARRTYALVCGLIRRFRGVSQRGGSAR